MKTEWRHVLEHRSTADKIAVAIDCDLAPVGDLPTIAELVREGIIEWIDCTRLVRILIIAEGRPVFPNFDVYRLTAKGVMLCDAEGIAQR